MMFSLFQILENILQNIKQKKIPHIKCTVQFFHIVGRLADLQRHSRLLLYALTAT